MRIRTRGVVIALVVGLVGVVAVGCSGDEATEGPNGSVTCDARGVSAGHLTVATRAEMLAPWFEDEPDSGKGYESEVAYAIAGVLGYRPDKVRWVTLSDDELRGDVPPTRFDLALGEFTPASLPKGLVATTSYYSSGLALIAPQGSALATGGATAVAAARLVLSGRAVSEDAATKAVGARAVNSVDGLEVAGVALHAASIDGILAETSAAVRAVNGGAIPDAVVVGRIADLDVPLVGGVPEGSTLRRCVDRGIARLRSNGALRRLDQAYLGELDEVPTIGR